MKDKARLYILGEKYDFEIALPRQFPSVVVRKFLVDKFEDGTFDTKSPPTKGKLVIYGLSSEFIRHFKIHMWLEVNVDILYETEEKEVVEGHIIDDQTKKLKSKTRYIKEK